MNTWVATPAPLDANRDRRFQLFLVALLLGSYLLTYVNTPESIDGQAIMAVANALAQHGRADIDALGANDWLLSARGQMGQPGVDGALYAKKGPTPSLFLLPLVALARWLPGLPIRATAMLFNPLVTVATALVLYGLLRKLRYEPLSALSVCLIYGLATLALVYTGTLFGEPLTGLLLLLAVRLALAYRQTGGLALAVGVALLLGLVIGVNTVYVLLVVPVAVYLFRGLTLSRRWLGHGLAFLGSLAAALALLGAYNWARFGSPLETGYHFAAGEGFTVPLLAGLSALLVGPYRGFFFYNPALLLAIPGWLMLRRRFADLAWLAATLFALQALGFAAWWSWHGGIVWGTRFLVPALPLAALCLAPIVEAGLARGKRHLLIVVGALAALSMGIQLLGALYSYRPYLNSLFRHFPDESPAALSTHLSPLVLHDPAYSPIIGHLALLSVGWAPQVAWLAGGTVDRAMVLAAGALLAFAWLTLTRGGRALWTWPRLRAGLLMLASCALVITAWRQRNAPGYGNDAVVALAGALQPPAVTLVASTLFDASLIDIESGARIITMNAPTAPEDARARQVWDYARQTDDWLWFVTWFGPSDPENWQERQLWQEAAFIQEREAAGHRALLFDLRTRTAPEVRGGWQFGERLVLEAYTISREADGVYVGLRWTTRRTAPEGNGNASWFVHLLDTSGQIVAQQDRLPQGGYAPTSAWQPGEAVLDRLFFPSPAATDMAGWRVRLGFVGRDGGVAGAPMPVTGPDGTRLPQDWLLLPLPTPAAGAR